MGEMAVVETVEEIETNDLHIKVKNLFIIYNSINKTIFHLLITHSAYTIKVFNF